MAEGADGAPRPAGFHLTGTPFEQAITENLARKQAIGRVAATLCRPGEGIMIDGGTTTLQMCPHLAGLDLQVLTNSLHIVNALLPQAGTRILVPSGAVFREQNIILAAAGEESMPRFHAPKLFMGAASVGPAGVMQADVVLVAAERRLIDRAEQVILLVDSSKFTTRSGTIVCGLDEVDTLITDAGISEATASAIRDAGVNLVIAR
jgi:DeoR family ulaG and ulaABCDEF operon transcriptional repressor